MEAITQANAAKDEQKYQEDRNFIDEGLRSLDETVNKDRKGEVEAAQEAARKAFEHFKNSSSALPIEH